MAAILGRSAIISEEHAARGYRQLVNLGEMTNIGSKMKLAIIALLADSHYRIRLKALKCFRLVLRNELISANLKALFADCVTS
ncbi:MAG: hypothetical protein P4M11_11065 [Candidatus Pacebacteria bacterium]|nr:hypothetical protein [Candidatus Paceibacterota bacterium]